MESLLGKLADFATAVVFVLDLTDNTDGFTNEARVATLNLLK